MNATRGMKWLLVANLTLGCAVFGGGATKGAGASANSAGGSGSDGVVSLTLPPNPQGLVLATAVASPGASGSATAPAAPGQTRAARPGDPYREALSQAYRQYKGLGEGKNADYIPALAQVSPALFGLVVVTVQGAIYEIGDARSEFSIQSVSKPFTLARAIGTAGPDAVMSRIGVNATGQKFNSIIAIELNKNLAADKQHAHPAGNPLVNAGAISTVDLVIANGVGDKWGVLIGNLNAFAGRVLSVNQEVYRSESETNTHNRAIVQLLKDYEVIQGDPMEALDLYTRQCSVSVNARDLAVMGATLANGGRNPVTGVEVVSPVTAAKVLAVMSTAGLYETTGEWLYKVGVPAKSGVGGGIVAVVPGRFAVASFSPPLDDAGNSVRGQRAIEAMVQRLGGNLFAAQPAGRSYQTGASRVAPATGTGLAAETPAAGAK